jgi:putative ABC transport system substrate-binding protein
MNKIVFWVLVFVAAGSALWFLVYEKVITKGDARVYKVGLIYQGDSFEQVVSGFKDGLDVIAKSDGLVIEYFPKRVDSIEQKDFDFAAKELVEQNVDLIFATSIEPIVAAKKVTAENKIPVVLALGGNPVSIGLVDSIQRPGGNLTGMTWLAWELSGKRLEILSKIDPKIKRVIVFGKKGSKPIKFSLESMKPVAERLGISLIIKEVDDFKDLEKVVAGISRSTADAIYYAPDPFISRNATFVIQHSLEQKLPTIFADEYFAQQGALAAYGGNFYFSGKQASRIAAKILFENQHPQDIPIESVIKIDLAINLESATKIGLVVPQDVLALTQTIIRGK